jgi:hypothetical protein
MWLHRDGRVSTPPSFHGHAVSSSKEPYPDEDYVPQQRAEHAITAT